MELYKTIKCQASAEQVIEKSRFITHVSPVESREEADAFIESLKKKYKDATHNVPAIVLGDKQQIQWASDDGEPQGTSGAPVVQMLVNEGISNVAVVITRYFGGIKLGTGGLVRAYTSSAKLGIEAAGICSVREMARVSVEVDYSYLNKFQNMEAEGLYRISDAVYGEKVLLTLICEKECLERLLELINNITAGTGIVTDQSDTLEKCEVCVQGSTD